MTLLGSVIFLFFGMCTWFWFRFWFSIKEKRCSMIILGSSNSFSRQELSSYGSGFDEGKLKDETNTLDSGNNFPRFRFWFCFGFALRC